eukprot:jgi/Phyca11/97877/e_gw1.2.326.1
MTSSTEERLKKNAQREFWTEMRELLSVNQSSSGLFVLDQLAEALLDNASTENKEMAFTDPIMLLPKPSRQREAPNAYPKPVTPPSTLGKRKQTSKSDDESKPKIPKPTPTPTPETDYCPHVMTDSTPPTLLQDVEGIYRRAYNMGKTCHQLAYPWEGSKVWYDPVENESLHVAHWRFWMANRVRFFEWQLNMPYRGSFARSQRRRQTALARTARLKFISQCIEHWGYYGFLKLYEGSEPDRLLMWMGGQPSKNAPDAKQYDGPTIQNLSSLFTQDFEAYKARVKRALKPLHLDQGGFTSITELLVTTNALDPDQKVDCRLSDEALALVRRDVQSKEEPGAEWWVGDLTEGVWARLVNNRWITQVEYQLQHRDGTFTALQAAPLEKPIDERDSDSFDPDTSDEDEVEVLETKAPAPMFAA